MLFFKVWPALGRSGLLQVVFYCFRNENFAFFNLSGKARVDPKTFRLSCSETSAWRGALSGVSQSYSLFTKTFWRLTEKKLNKMPHFYSNDLCDVNDAMRCPYLLQQHWIQVCMHVVNFEWEVTFGALKMQDLTGWHWHLALLFGRRSVPLQQINQIFV